MTDLERARAYVAKMPPAISGQGGHDATFAVAKALIHNFALTDREAWPILLEYNERCSPPWSEQELRHKIESAKNLTRAKRERGALANNKPYQAAYCPIPGRKPMRATETEPRILGQVSIEMFEPSKPSLLTPTEQSPDLAPRAEQTAIEAFTEYVEAEPLEKPSLADPDNIEANRIVGELRKLKRRWRFQGSPLWGYVPSQGSAGTGARSGDGQPREFDQLERLSARAQKTRTGRRNFRDQ
jgi:hypothetical protein